MLASVSRSDCSGSTSSVTTLTGMGLPFSASCSIFVPAASTCTFVSTTFEVMSSLCSLALAVATTSTRVPGST